MLRRASGLHATRGRGGVCRIERVHVTNGNAPSQRIVDTIAAGDVSRRQRRRRRGRRRIAARPPRLPLADHDAISRTPSATAIGGGLNRIRVDCRTGAVVPVEVFNRETRTHYRVITRDGSEPVRWYANVPGVHTSSPVDRDTWLDNDRTLCGENRLRDAIRHVLVKNDVGRTTVFAFVRARDVFDESTLARQGKDRADERQLRDFPELLLRERGKPQMPCNWIVEIHLPLFELVSLGFHRRHAELNDGVNDPTELVAHLLIQKAGIDAWRGRERYTAVREDR